MAPALPRFPPLQKPFALAPGPRTILYIHTCIYSNAELLKQFEVLVDAAKYDASCASSGAPKRGSRGINGLGATTGAGIRDSFTPDGRCVSLLKIMLANFCLYDCQYCVNRLRPASSEAG
jgi:predicted DNA-binding helix-hairpin-helix protein